MRLASLHPERLARLSLLFAIVILCIFTRMKWGSVTVDCGREMYVPAALLQGKRLYFDLWYAYGPLIPYWNALLFRIFGINLAVLYASGILLVTIMALRLFSLSRNFLPVSLSFAIVFGFLLQAFQVRIFNYVLPYSYAAAYGALFSVLLLGLLWKDSWPAMFASGLLAGLIGLTKLEFGVAAYGALGCAIIFRALAAKSWRKLLIGAALSLPGLILCAGIYARLIAQSSVSFIFGENISLLPNSYFAREFSKRWTENLGLTLSPFALALSFLICVIGIAAWILAIRWTSTGSRLAILLTLAILFGLMGLHLAVIASDRLFHHPLPPVLSHIAPVLFFNSGMIWSGAFLLVFVFTRWIGDREASENTVALCILAAYSIFVGSRVFTATKPEGYSVFYDTLPYLTWVVLLYSIFQEKVFSTLAFPSARLWTGVAAVLCCGVTALTAANYSVTKRPFLLETNRGQIYTDRITGEAYQRVLALLAGAKQRSERFVTVPEDVSLYFFSDIPAPSRWYIITPGVLPPGSTTTAYLEELDAQAVRYVLVSNRAAPEYGTPIFGRDYDQAVYRWIQQKYTLIDTIGSYTEDDPYPLTWGVRVYERRSATP